MTIETSSHDISKSKEDLLYLDSEIPGAFQVMCTGQIVSAQFFGIDNLYCRYSLSYGPDWRILHGVDSGLSQIAYKAGGSNLMTWNFPIDVSFSSTNPYGWPQLIVSLYGVDALGRDVVRGYGSVHLPIRPGSFVRYIPLFAPVSSSLLQQLVSWLKGTPPEFFDSKFVGQGEGREVTRVRSEGVVKVQFNIVTHGMVEHGYDGVQEKKSTLPFQQLENRF